MTSDAETMNDGEYWGQDAALASDVETKNDGEYWGQDWGRDW